MGERTPVIYLFEVILLHPMELQKIKLFNSNLSVSKNSKLSLSEYQKMLSETEWESQKKYFVEKRIFNNEQYLLYLFL